MGKVRDMLAADIQLAGMPISFMMLEPNMLFYFVCFELVLNNT